MINISLSVENAARLLNFIGEQDINDTERIVNKYGLKYNVDEYEESLQYLYDELNYGLKNRGI